MTAGHAGPVAAQAVLVVAGNRIVGSGNGLQCSGTDVDLALGIGLNKLVVHGCSGSVYDTAHRVDAWGRIVGHGVEIVAVPGRDKVVGAAFGNREPTGAKFGIRGVDKQRSSRMRLRVIASRLARVPWNLS